MSNTMRNRARAGVALLVGALLASACTTNEAAGTGTESPDYEVGMVGDQPSVDDPVSGGTLTLAAYSEPRSLDPAQTFATGASGGIALAAVYDTLMRYDVESGEYEPRMAKSLQKSADLKTWTLRLRPGVEFGDGTPLDADAVVGSIDYYLRSGGSDAPLLAPNIVSMQTPDELTVVFGLQNAWSTFPAMLAQGVGMIVAPAAINGGEFTPIGAGPFELENYAPQEELVLRARKEYWGGAPHLDALRFIWLQGGETTLDALETGAVDVAYLRGPEVIEDARQAGYPGFMTVFSVGNALAINTREGRPGADLRVRKAIAYAVDPDVSYQRAYDGAGLPGKAIFPEISRWHTGTDPLPVNVEKAIELLDAAKAAGFSGELTYLGSSDPASRAEGLTAKAMLERVGFTVRLDFVRSIADIIQRVNIDHDFDVARVGFSTSEGDPYQRLNNQLDSQSRSNVTGYANPEMDLLLDRLQSAASDEEKKQVISEIEKLWHEGVPIVVLGAAPVFIAWEGDVHGIAPTASSMLFLDSAWLDR